MNRVLIKKIERNFTLELCKVNREVIGVIDSKYLDSIKRSIIEIDNLEVSIPKYVYQEGKKIINPIWYECKEERLVCLNNKEYFVLKRNSYQSDENKKSFTAYSLEYKLSKQDVSFEDVVVTIFYTQDNIDNDYISLNELLKKQTGWEFRYIDEDLFYVKDEEGILHEKIRIQTSVNKRWYDYIVNDMVEMYGCVPIFDSYNKKIDLYDIKKFGEEIELFLSEDNYIKNLKREGNTENLVTRLFVIGQDEMDIIEATVTGYPYIENFSYFYDDMSEDLYNHLMKYYEMIELRTPIWNTLVSEKLKTVEELYRKQTELYTIYSEIKANEAIFESYKAKNDDVNAGVIASELTKLRDEKVILEVEIKRLEKYIMNLTESITEINILCKKETATDENGYIIFTPETLEELKEFVYSDTYTNDSFVNVEDLMTEAKRQLELKCFPNIEYNLDLKKFITRIEKNSFNINWNGDIGLGDIIILNDLDLNKNILLYINAYTQYPNSENDENEMDIEISNQKITTSDVRFIGDKLKEVELNNRLLKRKLYLINDQKYNRINLTRENSGGYI